MNKPIHSELIGPRQQEQVKELLLKHFGQSGSKVLEGQWTVTKISKGASLFEEGALGNEMYIVLSGMLDAQSNKHGRNVRLGSVVQGESVGEMALLGRRKRTASVVARRDSLLLQINLADFERITTADNTLLLHLNQVVIDRLDKANQAMKTNPPKSKFIALYAVDQRVDLATWATKLAEYWGSSRNLHFIRQEDLRHDSDDLSLIINNFSDKDYVFLLASNDPDWNANIRSNADKVIYFANEDQWSAFNRLDSEIRPAYDQLVLCYEGKQTPQKAIAFTKYFKPANIHRCNQSNPHRERVIRFICETAICLVLGGGGAHGLATLGVIRSLYERGIPIDVIGGTSIGSIIAGAFAQDWDFDYIYEQVEQDISKKNPLTDYTLPMVAMLRGKNMKRMLKKHFDIEIMNSWKNFFCVASNLSTAKTELMETGPLYQCIAASISIPGILPPQLHRKSLLIDGGVLNNLPADIMRQQYRGHIISVDVVSSKQRVIEQQYTVGNWQFIKNWITGKKKNYVPGTMNTLMKAVTLASAERSEDKERVSDLYIRTRIKKGFLAWKEMDAFVDGGYRETKALLNSLNATALLELPRIDMATDYS